MPLTPPRIPTAACCRPALQVYARVTPEQKEVVVKTLRHQGLHVLMCGDGTNDVGALKGARILGGLACGRRRGLPLAAGQQAARQGVVR